MPEIAEVETVRRTLKNKILNKRIKEIKVLYKGTLENDINDLVGESFVDIKRIGKYLVFETEAYYLLSHLRMEGKYFLKSVNEEIVKHEHVIIVFDDLSDLRYHDTRKFGKMRLVLKDDLYEVEGIKKQGIEPNDKLLTKEYLLDKFKNKRLPIKSVLLDQTIISGLGNIYADEVLFDAKINPLERTCLLKIDDCDRIVKSSNKIIKEAILMGGTTIKSYTSSLGVTGLFQQKLMVHQRKDQECKICNTLINKIKVGGRGTYYCSMCQGEVNGK